MGCRPSRHSSGKVADSTLEYDKRQRCYDKKKQKYGKGNSKCKKAARFSAFSTVSRTYHTSDSRSSKITVRLSTDGSVLQIEQYEVDNTGAEGGVAEYMHIHEQTQTITEADIQRAISASAPQLSISTQTVSCDPIEHDRDPRGQSKDMAVATKHAWFYGNIRDGTSTRQNGICQHKPEIQQDTPHSTTKSTDRIGDNKQELEIVDLDALENDTNFVTPQESPKSQLKDDIVPAHDDPIQCQSGFSGQKEGNVTEKFAKPDSLCKCTQVSVECQYTVLHSSIERRQKRLHCFQEEPSSMKNNTLMTVRADNSGIIDNEIFEPDSHFCRKSISQCKSDETISSGVGMDEKINVRGQPLARCSTLSESKISPAYNDEVSRNTVEKHLIKTGVGDRLTGFQSTHDKTLTWQADACDSSSFPQKGAHNERPLSDIAGENNSEIELNHDFDETQSSPVEKVAETEDCDSGRGEEEVTGNEDKYGPDGGCMIQESKSTVFRSLPPASLSPCNHGIINNDVQGIKINGDFPPPERRDSSTDEGIVTMVTDIIRSHNSSNAGSFDEDEIRQVIYVHQGFQNDFGDIFDDEVDSDYSQSFMVPCPETIVNLSTLDDIITEA